MAPPNPKTTMTNPGKDLANVAITPEQWQIIASILQKHVPNNEVWTFRSPATYTEKPYSDLDLAIISDNGLNLSLLAAVEHDFSESALPF